jgi:hypothetical protein
VSTFRQFKLGKNPSAQLIAWLAQHDAVDSICLRRVGSLGRKHWQAQAFGDSATIAEIELRIRTDRVSIGDVLRRLGMCSA